MSLPQFPSQDQQFTREEVINQILSSIALEELGLSHIINAEGEKIQYVLGTIPGVSGPAEPPSISDLLEINQSVRSTLDSAMENQMMLKAKMQSALQASVLQGPTGPTGPVAPFLSSYMEAMADGQVIPAGDNIAFDIDSYDSVGGNIEIDPTGKILTINEPGLYHVEWTLNLIEEADGTVTAIVGILENGQPSSGAASTVPGSFSSGTVIEVDSTPFTISLHNYDSQITIEHPTTATAEWQGTAASIRIVRFADGPSV